MGRLCRDGVWAQVDSEGGVRHKADPMSTLSVTLADKGNTREKPD